MTQKYEKAQRSSHSNLSPPPPPPHHLPFLSATEGTSLDISPRYFWLTFNSKKAAIVTPWLLGDEGLIF